MLRKMFKKSSTQHKVIAFDAETSQVRILQVYSDQDGMLETEFGMYPKNECQTHYNELDGGLVYTFNMSHEAVVQAEQLKHLQKQVVLSRIFSFDTKSGSVNFKELLPWLVTFAALFFK